jgi:hypothetical protein
MSLCVFVIVCRFVCLGHWQICPLWSTDYDLPLADSHFKSYPIQLRVTLLAPHSDHEVCMRTRLARYVDGRIGSGVRRYGDHVDVWSATTSTSCTSGGAW